MRTKTFWKGRKGKAVKIVKRKKSKRVLLVRLRETKHFGIVFLGGANPRSGGACG